MTRRRRLTPPEIAVWRTVADTVPIRMPGAVLPDLPSDRAAVATDPVPDPPLRPAPVRATRTSAQEVLPDVERRLRKRVTTGRQTIEGSLDLHGLRQAEAHARLVAFVMQSHREGHRVVLVVTGKGRSGAEERGVLRRLVPMWLAEPSVAPVIVGFGAAGRGHGGEGALYIHLRNRERRPRP